MATAKRKIEIDEATATALEKRASEQGLSLPELIAEFARETPSPIELSSDEFAELDRRWAEVERGETVPHEDVVRWLRTWGTASFKPWRERET